MVVLKKHNVNKMEHKWEPNYRIVKLPSAWSAVAENQLSGKSKRCNIGDLKLKHPYEDWELKPSFIGKKSNGRFSFLCKLPDVEMSQGIIDHVQTQCDSRSREQIIQMINFDPDIDPLLDEAIGIWDIQLSQPTPATRSATTSSTTSTTTTTTNPPTHPCCKKSI